MTPAQALATLAALVMERDGYRRALEDIAAHGNRRGYQSHHRAQIALGEGKKIDNHQPRPDDGREGT